MPLLRDTAVVLGRLDYSETSQILVLFTREHGKVRAIAKGAKRSTRTRFAPAVDLLDVGSVIISVRHERPEGLATLTEWKQTESLSGLREKLDRLNSAQYVAEITARLTEDWDPHVELFDELLASLRQLAVSSRVLEIVMQFQITLLDQIGSLPRWDACILCGREGDLTHFSSFEGGLVCRDCEPGRVEKWEVSPTTVELLQSFEAREPIEHPPLSSAVPVFAVLNYHISHLMGGEPRLAECLVSARHRRQL